MRRVKAALAVATASLLGTAAPAFGGTIDQVQDFADTDVLTGIPVSDASVAAQTFTAGLTGGLDEVDLLVSKTPATGACQTIPDLTVEIRTVDQNLLPSATVLATTTVPRAQVADNVPNSLPGFLALAHFTSPAPVAAGTRYAIVARSAATSASNCGYSWFASSKNPYAGGIDAVSQNGAPFVGFAGFDLAFRTYVLAPPPDTDPPETTITNDVKRSKTGTAKFQFTADETATFECRLKGLKSKLRQFRECGSPQKVNRLEDGRFKFEVRAIDTAGNIDPTPDRDKFRVVD